MYVKIFLVCFVVLISISLITVAKAEPIIINTANRHIGDAYVPEMFPEYPESTFIPLEFKLHTKPVTAVFVMNVTHVSPDKKNDPAFVIINEGKHVEFLNDHVEIESWDETTIRFGVDSDSLERGINKMVVSVDKKPFEKNLNGIPVRQNIDDIWIRNIVLNVEGEITDLEDYNAEIVLIGVIIAAIALVYRIGQRRGSNNPKPYKTHRSL